MLELIKKYDILGVEFQLMHFEYIHEKYILYAYFPKSNKVYKKYFKTKESALWYILDKVNLLDDIRINKRIKPL